MSSGEKSWVRHVIAEGYRNQTAIAGDFTGDGKPDVIAGDITEGAQTIILYPAPAWKPVVLHTGVRTIHSAAMDVDGDGDTDFIGARYHPGLIYWLERPADPLRESWKYHVIDDASQGGVDGVHGLQLGDIDRDGRLDLVCSSGQPSGAFPDSVAWFRVPQSPRLAARWERYIVADRDAPGLTHYIGLGDVDGDRRLDVATAAKDSPGGNWFAWWRQPEESRKPWLKQLIAGGQVGATNILIADVNGDGLADFVASRGHGKGLLWFQAPQWTPHDISAELAGPHTLATGDIDRDGDIDVVTVAKDARLAAWFENDGLGSFTMHEIWKGQSAYDARLVDMNKDGRLDVLVAGFETNDVVWYENRVSPSDQP
ncbi:MAG: VCBS repeat-containing protein [Bryobacteraceae bacterium]